MMDLLFLPSSPSNSRPFWHVPMSLSTRLAGRTFRRIVTTCRDRFIRYWLARTRRPTTNRLVPTVRQRQPLLPITTFRANTISRRPQSTGSFAYLVGKEKVQMPFDSITIHCLAGIGQFYDQGRNKLIFLFLLPIVARIHLSFLNQISCEYDVPRPAMETYDTPRLVAINGGGSSPQPSSTGDEYDVPVAAGVAAVATRFQRNSASGNNFSDRSSGVSLFSSGSSEGSSAISNANRSASSESLSLSSAVGRISGRSSRSSVIDQQQQSFELYDVPTSTQVKETTAVQEEVYDVPKPAALPADAATLYDVPPPAVPSVSSEEIYDIPPSSRPIVEEASPAGETYDCPKPLIDWATDKVTAATLPLSLDAALETLSRLDAEVSSAVSNLLSFWRATSIGDWAELQLRVLRLRASLQELCDFARGAISNASQRIKSGLDDQGVAVRLTRLLRPLQDANAIVQKTSQSWTDLFATSRRHSGTDAELDQLLACCRNLGDDMRQVMTTRRA